MKKLLLGLFVLGSLSAIADSRNCTIEHKEPFQTLEIKNYNIPNGIQEEFVSMKLEAFPSLTFKSRENYDNKVFISLEIEGKQQFFVLGQQTASLAYYPFENDHTQKIIVTCNL